MIGAARYFAPRAFASRYWPKVGADAPGGFQVAWARFSNVVIRAGRLT
jgi:hypothetical protein